MQEKSGRGTFEAKTPLEAAAYDVINQHFVVFSHCMRYDIEYKPALVKIFTL